MKYNESFKLTDLIKDETTRTRYINKGTKVFSEYRKTKQELRATYDAQIHNKWIREIVSLIKAGEWDEEIQDAIRKHPKLMLLTKQYRDCLDFAIECGGEVAEYHSLEAMVAGDSAKEFLLKMRRSLYSVPRQTLIKVCQQAARDGARIRWMNLFVDGDTILEAFGFDKVWEEAGCVSESHAKWVFKNVNELSEKLKTACYHYHEQVKTELQKRLAKYAYGKALAIEEAIDLANQFDEVGIEYLFHPIRCVRITRENAKDIMSLPIHLLQNISANNNGHYKGESIVIASGVEAEALFDTIEEAFDCFAEHHIEGNRWSYTYANKFGLRVRFSEDTEDLDILI